MKRLIVLPLSALVLGGCGESPTGLAPGLALFDDIPVPAVLSITAPSSDFLLELVSNSAANVTTVSVRGQRTDGSGENSKVCGIRQFKLTAEREGTPGEILIAEGDGADKRFVEILENPSANCPADRTNDYDWDFDGLTPGIYLLRASGVAGQGTNAVDHEDTVEGEIVLAELEVVVDHAAAPSIAARLLAGAGIAHRYGSGRTGGNFVSDVARAMGPGTAFNGLAKGTAGYCEAVADFLNEHPQIGSESVSCSG